MKKDLKDKILALRKEIEKHNRLYYIENNPIISDEEYDFMVKDLERFEKEYKEKYGKLGKSPIETVGAPLSKTVFKKEKHSTPMLSLSNCYTFEEIEEFHNRILKLLNVNEVEYIAESKLDGFSISLIYEKGELIKALTRGDGIVGENVTKNVLEIPSLPKKLNRALDIEIRGEIILPLDSFKKINSEREAQQLPLFASPRNAAAGTIRQLDSSIVKNRNLRCILYQIVGQDIESELETLTLIKDLGLEPVEYYEYCKNLDEIKNFIDKFNELKKNLNYATDGVVIKVNSEYYKDILGFTNKSPRWAIAYKYPALQVTTQIKGITFQVGRTGVITPVAELEPISLAGAIITRATLHNMSEIKKKDIRIKDWVFLERSGEVIPKVIKPIKEKRIGIEEEIKLPEKCPSCSTPLKFELSDIIVKCINQECEAKLKKQIEFFASRDAMNIAGLGPAIVEKLFSLNKIRYVEDLYKLRKEDFENIEGFKEKSITNLLNSIEDSKNKDFSNVLFSLGIEHVGKHVANIVVEKFNSIEELKNATVEDLSSISGIGEKIAHSIIKYLNNSKNIERIEKLKNEGLKFSKINEKLEGKLKNKNFLFTGEFSKYKRNDLKKIIEAEGGNALSSLSKKVDYLVVGLNPGSKLVRAMELNKDGEKINIINEDELEKILQS